MPWLLIKYVNCFFQTVNLVVSFKVLSTQHGLGIP